MTSNENTHLQSYRELILVVIALLALTGLTVMVSRLDLGRLRVAVSLSIAAVKAGLVLLFFMHMKDSGRLIAVTFLATVLTVTILITFIFLDLPYR